MRITFVYPNIGAGRDARGFLPRGRLEPLVFAVLAGLTPRDVEVRFHVDRIEEVSVDEPADLVGISVEAYSARRLRQAPDAAGVGVKLALLNPNFSDHRSADAVQPLVYAVLKALTPGDVDTVSYDERVEPLPLDAAMPYPGTRLFQRLLAEQRRTALLRRAAGGRPRAVPGGPARLGGALVPRLMRLLR